MNNLRAIYHNDEDKKSEKQRGAWKILMTACEECGIDATSLANILGISLGMAMMYFKQGAVELKLNDDQYIRLAQATGRTPHFWKSLFEL